MTIILCVVFFLSGISALVFESLWFRLSGLAFGNSVFAAAIVMASFMGGLSLGNALAAFLGDRIRSPLRFYAFLECTIGILGCLLVIVFPHLTKILVVIFQPFSDNSLLLNLLRTIFALALMLVPTTAMGITLPVLVKALYAKKHNFGNVLGLLYGWNTLGAVIGVMANELFFIKILGVRGAGFLAAFFNICAAVIALRLSKKLIGVYQKGFAEEGNFLFKFSYRVTRLLTAAFLSGFIFLALEMVWFRFMLLFFNSHSLNFAIMLATVLFGISCGGLLASKWFAKREDAHCFLICMLSLGGALIGVLYGNLETVLVPIIQRLASADLLKAVHLTLSFSFYLMFSVSVISGIIFTMLGEALHEEMKTEIKASGLLTMTNTLGGMCGSFIGGLVFIPWIGIENSFFVLGALYIIIICLVFDKKQYMRSKTMIKFHALTAGVFLTALIFFPFGLMKDVYLNKAIARYVNNRGEQRIAFREGITETIQYLEKKLWGEVYYYRLITNNHSMSGTTLKSKRYMKYFVYWPIAVHPQPKSALLIAFGCGTTAKALTDTKSLQTIDIVDTSEDVIQMADIIFPNPKENPVYDQRVNVHIEDGRFFLLTTKRKFDIITAEPPPLQNSGVENLYSQEYFQLIYNCLAEGGIVTYWLPVYQLELSQTKAVLKAFCAVFEDCSLWTGAGFEWMIVGIKNPQGPVSEEHFVRQWNDPQVGPEMRALGFMSPEEFGALFIADKKRIKDWVYPVAPLVDNYPYRLRYNPAHQRDKVIPFYWKFMHPDFARRGFIDSAHIEKIWPETLRIKTAGFFDINNILIQILESTSPIVERFHYCLHDLRFKKYTLWALYSNEYAQRIIAKGFKKGVIIPEKERGVYRHLAARAVLRKEYQLAENYYQKAAGDGHDFHQDYFSLRMYLMRLVSDKEKVKSIAQEFIDISAEGKTKRTLQVKNFWRWMNKVLEHK